MTHDHDLGVAMPADRRPMDLDSYVARARGGPCFVCAFLAGDPDYLHETVYEDEDCQEQQFHALMTENGVLHLPQHQATTLAAHLREALGLRPGTATLAGPQPEREEH